jgi:hypothetical protein
LAAFKAALANIDQQLSAKRTEHDEIIARELAEVHAKAKEKAVADFRIKLTNAAQALAELGIVVEQLTDASFLAQQLRDLCRSVAVDFDRSRDHVEEEIRYHCVSLREGKITPPTKADAPAPVAPPKPAVETRLVFTLFPVRWMQDGETVTAGQYSQAQLPINVADRSVALRYCIEFSDPRVRQLSRGFVPAPQPAACVDLDAADLAPAKAIFGQDRAASAAGMYSPTDGKNFNPVGA